MDVRVLSSEIREDINGANAPLPDPLTESLVKFLNITKSTQPLGTAPTIACNALSQCKNRFIVTRCPHWRTHIVVAFCIRAERVVATECKCNDNCRFDIGVADLTTSQLKQESKLNNKNANANQFHS
jgi:hypothetical protein